MGLAASQARLLLLTARQDDIQGQLMRISNQKISLARQSATISQQYSDALNATKLVWNYDDGSSGNISYNKIMSPDDGMAGQYLFTNANGAVMLSDSYASVIGNILLGDANAKSGSACTPTTAQAAAFLVSQMGISGSDALKYTQNYNASSAASTTGKAMSIDDFLEALEDENIRSNYEDLSYVTDSDNTNFDWNYAYNNDMVIQLGNKSGNYGCGTMDSSCDNLEEIMKNLVKSLSSDSSFDADALNEAYKKTIDRFTEVADNDKDNKYPSSADCPVFEASGDGTTRDRTESEARNYNSLVAVNNTNAKGHTFYGVSVKNLVDSFFTYYEQALGFTGDSTNYEVSKTRKGSNYAEDATSATTTTGTSSTSGQTQANHYLNMFYAICSKGWTRDSNITNDTYLSNAMQNGGVYLEALQSDGTWDIQTSSDSSNPISSESNEEAIARAEAEYDAKDDEINYKETQLDLKQNNLDTELSSIQTEMESVNKLIDNNVKVFKMFDA